MRELELARLKLSNLGGVELPGIHTEPSTKNSTGMLSSGRSGEGDVSCSHLHTPRVSTMSGHVFAPARSNNIS